MHMQVKHRIQRKLDTQSDTSHCIVMQVDLCWYHYCRYL